MESIYEGVAEFSLDSVGRDLNTQTPGMDVTLMPTRNEAEFAKEVGNKMMAGVPFSLPTPIPPGRQDFVYSGLNADQPEPFLSSKPGPDILSPPASAKPPSGRSYPQSPIWHLVQDNRYQGGWIYQANYYIKDRLVIDKDRMSTVSTPPNVMPTKRYGRYIADPIPGMVEMIAGVPYVFYLDGDPNRPYTMGCSHTLASLRRFNDWQHILELSVQLAKLAWGCKAHGDTPELPRLCNLNGLKRNDRSGPVDPKLPADYKDGSYSLANTVMKGEGLGVVLPASQSNSTPAKQQIGALLMILHQLYRAIMPKSISKFEMAMADFHSSYNNVITFGQEPGPTSCQYNVSSLGKSLRDLLGQQGFWHPDNLDDLTRYTLFVLLLHVGPKGDPGPFCLGRAGIYCREIGAWILFLVFKGNDIHSGFAPTEDLTDHNEWVETQLGAAWDHAGPQNRMGFVLYQTSAATNRSAGLNASPMQLFGNFGASQPHRTGHSTLAVDGFVSLGGERSYANHMGREAVLCLFNELRSSNLSLGIDLNDLLRSIKYKALDGTMVSLDPVSYHPVNDQSLIQLYLGHYAYLYSQCMSMYIFIDRHDFKKRLKQSQMEPALNDRQMAFNPGERPAMILSTSSPAVDRANELNIEQVIGRKVVGGDVFFTVIEYGSTEEINVHQDRLQGHPLAIDFVSQFLPEKVQALINSHHESESTVDPEISGTEETSEDSSLALSGKLTETNTSITPHNLRAVLPRREGNNLTHSTMANAISNVGDNDTVSKSASFYATRGTKRKLAAILNEEAEDELNDNGVGGADDEEMYMGEDYEVEKIISTQYNHATGEQEWEIKFVGYSNTSWEPMRCLGGCREMLKDFNKAHLHAHGYDPSLPRDQIDVSTETPSVSTIRRARIWDSGKLSGNLLKLQDLLSTKRIRAELAVLAFSQTAPMKADNNSSTIGLLTADWLERNQYHNILSNYVSLLPNGSSSAGGIHLHHVICAAQNLPIIMRDITKLNILSRLLGLEAARSLIFTYRWHAEHACTTANHLLGIHRSGGRDALNKQCANFAALVDHAFRFIEHEHLAATMNRQRTKRSKTVVDTPISTTDPKLDMLPGDLYGLKPSGKSSNISLRQHRYRTAYSGSWRTTEENRTTLIYQRTSLLLQELWSYELIIPHLTALDQHLNSGKHRSTQLEDIRNRALTRGAILHSIAQCLGTDAIFASEKILDFLVNPALVYGERLRQDKDFARSVLKNPEATLKPLVTWLMEHLSENSDVVQISEDLQSCLLQQAMKLSSSFNPTKFSLGPPPDTNPERHSRSLHGRKKLFSPITSRQLLLDGSPKFVFIALILREAINERQGLPLANETLNRVLIGKHATRASTQHNRDQTDPVRQYSGTAKSLQEHLPGAKLTNREGLSNLLAWMGTGQGTRTELFLRCITANGGFYSPTVDELVRKFEMVLTHNTRLLAENGFSSTKAAKVDRIPGYIPLDDVRIWGQPNNLLSATPVLPGATPRKCSLEEKFSPYFSDVILDSWMEWLGDLAGCDPAKYTGKLRSWKDGEELLAKLKLKGFLSGLTAFQLLNNLVFLGLASMPTCNDIADWIFENQTLGAYRGLIKLGFALTDCGSVRCAFGCVYGYLEKHLTDENKILLGFSPIFVEHVICKVVRWNKRLADEMNPPSSLDAFSAEALLHEHDLGRNQEFVFPFPLQASVDDLDQIVKHISSDWMGCY